MAKLTAFLRAVNAATKLKGVPVLNAKKAVSARIEARKLSIEQLQQLRKLAKPAPSQRQHEWRWFKGKAKYLLKFALPQGLITVGVLDGEYYIVDGNTRGFAWEVDASIVVPDQVLVVFYDIQSVEEMRVVYDAVDSAGSKKTVRNEVISSLRETGIDIERELQSDLMLSGALKGIMRAVSGTGGLASLRMSLAAYRKEILQLDSLKLREKPVKHSAVLAAALKLLKGGTPFELVKQYVMEFVYLHSGDNGALMKCTTRIELAADDAFLEMKSKTRSTSSAGAVTEMTPVYMTRFRTDFCRELMKAKFGEKLARLAAAELKKAA